MASSEVQMHAAYLWAHRQDFQIKSKGELSAMLEISPSETTKALKNAEHNGMLRTVCSLSPENIDRISTRYYSNQLKLVHALKNCAPNDFGDRLFEVRVFFAGKVQNGIPTQDNLAIFSGLVARHFAASLTETRTLGLSWGKTPASLVAAFLKSGSAEEFELDLQAFPLCGEAMEYVISEYSASVMAARVHDFFRCGQGFAYSLGAVPARLPRTLAGSQLNQSTLQILRDYVSELGSYRRVFGFGEGAGLVNTADGFLVTAGSIYKDPTDIYMQDLVAGEGVQADALSAWSVGDLGGFFLKRPEADSLGHHHLDDLNDRWTGFQLEHSSACAQRAAAGNGKKKLGVALASVGSAKAEIVIEVVRRGLVNRLWIDPDLADAIVAILENTDAQ